MTVVWVSTNRGTISRKRPRYIVNETVGIVVEDEYKATVSDGWKK